MNAGPADATEAYAGKGITIHDNRAICAHSGVCTDNLAAVFRLNTEPWIDTYGATAEEIVALVKRCPSGALIMVSGLIEVTPKAASDLARPNVLVPWLHAFLGGATIACALWLVLQMNGFLPERLHVRGWKMLMRLTLAGYWLVALLGLLIYYLWFV